MGYVIDHLPRTKLGRFRSYVIIGTVITSAVFLLTWLGPSLATTGKVFLAFLGYILFGFVFDLMDIPLNSMISVMSDRDRDRTTLSNIKGFAYMFGGVVIYASALPIVGLFDSQRAGYHWLIIFFTAFVLIFSVIGTLGIKERVNPIKKEKYHIRDLFKILGNRAVFTHFLNQLVMMTANGILQGAIIFFLTYVLNRPDLFTIFGVSRIIGTVIALAILPVMSRKLGKKNTKTIADFVTIAGYLAMFFIPADQPMLFVLVLMITAPGMGMTGILMYNIQADNTDYVEWKLGHRAEGAVASANSFIIKAGLGLGSGIGAYILGMIGYVPNAVQSPDTIQGLYSLNFLIPAVLSVLGLILWVALYPINKKTNEQMLSDLIKIREKENAYSIEE